MIFTETSLKGAFIIDIEPHVDDRGFFARSYCAKEFNQHGLKTVATQCNISFNGKKATLRGMHYQSAPCQEAKLVRCTMGAIYDVIVDLRPNSSSFRKWIALELNEENRSMIYIPEGFAHGFLTLSDNSEVFYHMSEYYAPEYARGFPWNDQSVSIHWPSDIQIISERDRNLPNLEIS